MQTCTHVHTNVLCSTAYTQAYIAETRHHTTCDPFRNMSSQEFISVITAKAKRHLRIQRRTNVAFNVKVKNNKGKGQSLLKCMTSKLKDMKLNNDNKEQSDKKTKKLYCKHCKTQGHLTNNCKPSLRTIQPQSQGLLA
jgi:hypothetical protein